VIYDFISDNIIVLGLALLWDTFLGEPATPLHPVVWLGRLVKLFKRFAPAQGQQRQLVYGLIGVIVSIGLVYTLTRSLVEVLQLAPAPGRWLVETYLCKSCFSLRMLAAEGYKIANQLKRRDIEAARLELRSLVSRNTAKLNDDLIIAATIESIAENTTDSFVAPLCFYALLGLPGMLTYRLVNTFDSMVGYRGTYEFLGKVAARLDDILNFIPARLTALLLILNAPLYEADSKHAWKIARRDHNRTASPNAGWTMAAIAGALHIQLEKVGYYTLGDNEGLLLTSMISQTIKAMYLVALELVAFYMLLNLF
jgi:adenosylcobinamide-phosphate synthase